MRPPGLCLAQRPDGLLSQFLFGKLFSHVPFTSSRLLCHHLAILPNIDRRSVHAGRFAGNFRGATKGTSDRSRKLFAISPLPPFHDDRSTSLKLSHKLLNTSLLWRNVVTKVHDLMPV